MHFYFKCNTFHLIMYYFLLLLSVYIQKWIIINPSMNRSNIIFIVYSQKFLFLFFIEIFIFHFNLFVKIDCKSMYTVFFFNFFL